MSSARERRRLRRQEIVKADSERVLQAYWLAEIDLGRAPLDAQHCVAGAEAYSQRLSELALEKFKRLN